MYNRFYTIKIWPLLGSASTFPVPVTELSKIHLLLFQLFFNWYQAKNFLQPCSRYSHSKFSGIMFEISAEICKLSNIKKCYSVRCLLVFPHLILKMTFHHMQSRFKTIFEQSKCSFFEVLHLTSQWQPAHFQVPGAQWTYRIPIIVELGVQTGPFVGLVYSIAPIAMSGSPEMKRKHQFNGLEISLPARAEL